MKITGIILLILIFTSSIVFLLKPAKAVIRIEMFDTEYKPSHITIKKGQTVIFENKGKNNHWPASNIHPTHGIYPEFDPKRSISPNDSWSFTFNQTGIWRMHDHDYPEITGVITVE
jgi:plastocyanin